MSIRGKSLFQSSLIIVGALIGLWMILQPGLGSGSEVSPPETDGRSAAESRARPVLVGSGPQPGVTTEPEDREPAPGPSGIGVSGVVLDRRTREPISDAWVALLAPTESLALPEFTARTSEEGEFSVDGASGAEGTLLVVLASGYLPEERGVQGAEEQTVLLDEGASLAGKVVDASGRGIAGARVTVAREGNRIGFPFGKTSLVGRGTLSDGGLCFTDTKGRFLLTGLTLGETYLVRASKSGFLGVGAKPVRAGEEPVVVRLMTRTAVVFQVLDADSRQPIPHYAAITRLPLGCMYLSEQVLRRVQFLSGAAPDPVSRGERHVLFDDLLAEAPPCEVGESLGKMALHLYAAGYESVTREFAIDRGESKEVEILLKRRVSKPLGRVSLQALFAADAPFTGALRVEITDMDHRDLQEPPSVQELRFANGRADRPLMLPVGRYRVTPTNSRLDESHDWWRGPGESVMVAVEGSDKAVLQTLSLQGNRIRLTVRDAYGARVHGYDLFVDGRRGLSSWNQTGLLKDASVDASVLGEPRSIWVGPGTRVLKSSLPGVGSASVEVTADGSGTDVPLEVVLDRS